MKQWKKNWTAPTDSITSSRTRTCDRQTGNNIKNNADGGRQPNNSMAEENRFSDPVVDSPKELGLHVRTKLPKPYQNACLKNLCSRRI